MLFCSFQLFILSILKSCSPINEPHYRHLELKHIMSYNFDFNVKVSLFSITMCIQYIRTGSCLCLPIYMVIVINYQDSKQQWADTNSAVIRKDRCCFLKLFLFNFLYGGMWYVLFCVMTSKHQKQNE